MYRLLRFVRKKSIGTANMKLSIILFIMLIIADMVSDIVLSVDYCVTDHPWWCVLTWVFIIIPVWTGLLTSSWMICESTVLFKSGPQLMIHLYIMALTDLNSGKSSSSLCNQLFETDTMWSYCCFSYL